VGLERRDVHADIRWNYNRSVVPFSLRLFRNVGPRGGLVVAGEERPWAAQTYGGELSVFYSFPARLAHESIGLSYSLSYVDKAEPFGGRLDPNDPPPTLPRTGFLGTLRVNWSYSDTYGVAHDVSTSGGRAFWIGLGVSDKWLLSDFTGVSAGFGAAQYVKMPWHDLHVLALRYGGGLSAGPNGRRTVFSVGGFPDVDLVDGILDEAILGGVALRGFDPSSRTGTQFHLLQVEYRFPLLRLEQGIGTLPAYLYRLSGALFADYGDAFYGAIDFDSFRLGLGGQLLLDFTLGYILPFTLRTGVAQGLGETGRTQVYAHIGVPF
jgi:hypothetical protein